MKLSILICSIEERKEQLASLLKSLQSQIKDAGEVEILTQIDSGEQGVAAKRNDLLVRAQGDYIVYIDDDDKVPDYYIAEILKAIESRPSVSEIHQKITPDVVGFGGHYFQDGVRGRDFILSVKYDRWFDDAKGYYRCPNHISPVKRSLALKVGFNESLRRAEDYDYSMRLRPHLKTEAFINRPMYFYYYSPRLSRISSSAQEGQCIAKTTKK